MTTFKTKSDTKILLPFFILKKMCMASIINMIISGISAGNIKKLSNILPSNKSLRARWQPHHGHSIPKYFL